jgi:2,4-dienoyl-CoA reductase-like NADH-dependent reductase (Old Yellow Enzyme family)
VEQFLGPIGAAGRLGVRYVEVRPTKASYDVYVHTVEDVGHETFFDLVEFPSLNVQEGEEEFGRRVAAAEDPSTALAVAEEAMGAVRGRWVNQNMVQDEYVDFVRAGRPAHQAPDGHPWPSPVARN